MEKIGKKGPPTQHPKPFQSVLWPHLELIRNRRRQRQPWRVIVEELHNQHGVQATLPTLMRFFQRVSQRTQDGKTSPTLPLGFAEVVEDTPASMSSSHRTAGERIRTEANLNRQKIQKKESKWKFPPVFQEKEKHNPNEQK